MALPELEYWLRLESGRMRSALTRVFGLENLDLAEDADQDTLLQACRLWPFEGVPENPSGWLYRTARNKVLDILRRQIFFRKFSLEITYLLEIKDDQVHLFLPSEIADDMLRLIFACCHPSLPFESPIVLTLETLCSFNTAEIATAFFYSRLPSS